MIAFRGSNQIDESELSFQKSDLRQEPSSTKCSIQERRKELTVGEKNGKLRYVDLAPARSKCSSSGHRLTAKAFNNHDTLALLIANGVQAATH